MNFSNLQISVSVPYFKLQESFATFSYKGIITFMYLFIFLLNDMYIFLSQNDVNVATVIIMTLI